MRKREIRQEFCGVSNSTLSQGSALKLNRSDILSKGLLHIFFFFFFLIFWGETSGTEQNYYLVVALGTMSETY